MPDIYREKNAQGFCRVFLKGFSIRGSIYLGGSTVHGTWGRLPVSQPRSEYNREQVVEGKQVGTGSHSFSPTTVLTTIIISFFLFFFGSNYTTPHTLTFSETFFFSSASFVYDTRASSLPPKMSSIATIMRIKIRNSQG
jgi:hypothetical protein